MQVGVDGNLAVRPAGAVVAAATAVGMAHYPRSRA